MPPSPVAWSGSRADEVMTPTTPDEPKARRPTATRLALTRKEAALALAMSVDSFERYVQPEIRIVRRVGCG
jgi:hypothetical protein